MKISTMKRLDHYAGLPICFFLSVFERLASLVPVGRRAGGEVRTVVVSKYFGLGSMVLATPMFRAVRAKFPGARIVFLTFAGNEGLLGLVKEIDEVRALRTDSPARFACDLFKTLFYLRRRKVDIFFDLEFFSKFSTVVTYLSGARSRVGYHVRHMWRGELLTCQVHYNTYKHITEVFLAQAGVVGADTGDARISDLRGPLSGVPATSADELPGLAGADKIVSVNVNAGELCLERRWPARNFAALIGGLAREYPALTFAMIGDAGQRKDVEEVCRMAGERGNVVNLAGRLSFIGLCRVLARSALFIGNDSGPLHLSLALGIPTVSFFGPETPAVYGPRSGENRVFYKGLYCSPCLNVYNAKTTMCGGKNVCMEGIGVDEVHQAVKAALDKHG